MLGAVKQRQPATEHIRLAIVHLVNIAFDSGIDREMGMHHTLGVARGAAGVHQQSGLIVINVHIRQRVWLALLRIGQ